MNQPPECQAGSWLTRIESPDASTLRGLLSVYGHSRAVLDERIALLRSVIAAFIGRFGNQPVRIFRSPGRINLRGMHVDTHGGYLNLMTHQREVVAVTAAACDSRVVFANTDPRYEEVDFDIREETSHGSFADEWSGFIGHPDIQRLRDSRRGHWGNYLRGTALRIAHRFQRERLSGVRGVVGSDIPTGAALSSSHALCTAVLAAMVGWNGRFLDDASRILAVRDAEWYAGARTGVSDQGAMILAGRDELVNAALFVPDLDTSTVRRMTFPDELRVLVANSFTERSLSGAHLVEYSRNRFAYSLALEIIRQEMRAQGFEESLVASTDRLSRLSPFVLEPVGGLKALYGLLRRIPQSLTLTELRQRYDLPNIDAAYEQCFGPVPKGSRPTDIALRGPLLFGIAESERARVFFDALRDGDFVKAGRLMTVGHDGDRRRDRNGSRFRYDVGDTAIDLLDDSTTPIEWCPGVYGASSPVLDALVDAALDAGALGASLTGAGIAGTVLALCRAQDAHIIAEAIRQRLASPDYNTLAGATERLSEDKIGGAVVANQATAAAGELVV